MDIKFIKRITLLKSEKIEIFELWNNEYPEKLAYNSIKDFDLYLEKLTNPSHVLLVNSNNKIKGWYADFIRDHEQFFVLILDSKIHGKGLGTKVLDFAKEETTELKGWVIDHHRDKKRNGTFYKSPLDFYLKNGFKKLPEDRLELEKISAVKIEWKK